MRIYVVFEKYMILVREISPTTLICEFDIYHTDRFNPVRRIGVK